MQEFTQPGKYALYSGVSAAFSLVKRNGADSACCCMEGVGCGGKAWPVQLVPNEHCFPVCDMQGQPETYM